MALVERLTPKELQCMYGVARHLQANEIAAQLGLAQVTVETPLSPARRTLGLTSSRPAWRTLLEAGELPTQLVEGFSTASVRAAVSSGHRLKGGGHDETGKDDPGLVPGGLE